MHSSFPSLYFILSFLMIENHAQITHGDSDCKDQLGHLFWNTSVAHGIGIYYKHEFIAMEQNASVDLAMEIYLLDTYERTEVNVESIAVFLPQALESAENFIAHELVAFFSEDLGQTLKCSWPFDSYVLLTNLETVDQVDGVEFAVTNLPYDTHFQLYIRFKLKDSEVAHANINLRTPETSPVVREEFFYPNVTDYLDDYDEGHNKAIRRRQVQNILDLRRGRRPKRPLQSDDPLYRHLLDRKIHERDDDDDYDAKPTALKQSKRKGLYTIDLHTPTNEKKKEKLAHRGISGKGTSARDPGGPPRKLFMAPKLVKIEEEEEEKASEEEDDDDEVEKTGVRGSARALDAIQDAKSADAYGNRTAEEHVLGTKLLYSPCGSNHSCFSYPEECNFAHNCYMTVAMSKKGDMVHVVMAGVTANWVAVGLSIDDKMGDDAVFICKRVPGSRRVSIWQAYNLNGKETYSIGTVIQETQNVIGRTGAVYNGILTCDMHIPLKFKTDKGVQFDLVKEPYYILLAVGIRIVETKIPGGIQKHDYSTASNRKIFIGSDKGADILAPITHYAITIHEYLSVITFGLLMPVGILFGCYGQSGFHGKMFGLLPSWLCVHVIMQGLSTVLNIINFLIILIGRVGSAYATSSSTYHAVIGILIFLGSFATAGFGIAMLVKKFKGNSDELQESMRWTHWVLGHTTQLFGAIELIRGAYLTKSFLVCSFSLIAGYMLLFYCAANVLLMLNTDILRQKQELDEPALSSFVGPALELKTEVPNEHFRDRKLIIIFATLLLCMCTLFLIVQINLSVLGCNRLSNDYI